MCLLLSLLKQGHFRGGLLVVLLFQSHYYNKGKPNYSNYFPCHQGQNASLWLNPFLDFVSSSICVYAVLCFLPLFSISKSFHGAEMAKDTVNHNFKQTFKTSMINRFRSFFFLEWTSVTVTLTSISSLHK